MKIFDLESFSLAVREDNIEEKHRLAVILPGLFDSKDFPHMKSYVDFMANHNYRAIAIDPPGTWDSPGDTSIYTMSNYIKATCELLEHLDYEHIVLIGQSLGGIVAPFIAQKIGVNAIVSITSPKYFCDFREGILHIGDMPIKSFGPTDTKTSIRSNPDGPTKTHKFEMGYNFIEDSFQYDVRKIIGKLEIPKLYIGATRDNIVPPEKIEEYIDITSSLTTYQTIDSVHDYWKDPQQITKTENIMSDFFKSHFDSWD